MLRQITSIQHSMVKHLVKLRQNRDYRYEHHSLIIEGITLMDELSRENHFKCVAARHESLLPIGLKAEDILIVTEQVMHKISGMPSPEGIIAEISMPQPASLEGLHFVVALDGVNDSGNLGTLLRTALALGWEGVFILENSCDPFNEKALRAARGATFRLPLAWGNWHALELLIRNNNLQAYAANLHGTPLNELPAKDRLLLVLGNEARGISDKAKKSCQAVAIPMPGEMESLNVAIAGGIMMYVLMNKKGIA